MVEQDTVQLTGIGVASRCPVLVGALATAKASELPEMPSLQHVDDELPYTLVLPAPIVHRKYSHPALERAAACQGWVCQHTASHVTIISPTGVVLHTANLVRRTTAAVRQEILELEMLMQGMVMKGSTCTMVRFQDEINQIREMTANMLAGITCTNDTLPAETDYTGLRQFCREYESALAALWARREECVKELRGLDGCCDLLVDGIAPRSTPDAPMRRQPTGSAASRSSREAMVPGTDGQRSNVANPSSRK